MSRRPEAGRLAVRRAHASVFAALGDETRLLLVGKLCRGRPCSISHLTEGSRLTRQAVTKHLRVLENAGFVAGRRRGREILFRFMPGAVEEARTYLELVSHQWEQTLARLKSFVESDGTREPPR